jgi:hypothetical protein
MTDQREALREALSAAYAFGQINADPRTLDGLLAALPSTPQPEGLDEERLARAMACESDTNPAAPEPLWDLLNDGLRDVFRRKAKVVAAEYARLAPTPPEPKGRP